MQVKIIRPKPGVWYENHVGEIINVEVSDDETMFPLNETYRVTGPKKLLKYYRDTCEWYNLGIDICDVKNLRLDKIKRIIGED